MWKLIKEPMVLLRHVLSYLIWIKVKTTTNRSQSFYLKVIIDYNMVSIVIFFHKLEIYTIT